MPPARPGTLGSGRKAPPTTPPGRSPEDVQALLESARTRGQRFEEALRLLAQGIYHEAREALHKITAEDPQSRRYRVALHLAWGLEYREAGDRDKAIRELERAVALDPECTEAVDALRKLQEKRGGILGKLFGL